MIVHLLDLGLQSPQRRLRIGAFAHGNPGRDHVGVVDDDAVFAADAMRELAQADLRPLRDHGDVFDVQRRAVLGIDHRVFDIAHGVDQADFLHVDLLQAGFDEAAARVDVVVGKLLLDLRRG